VGGGGGWGRIAGGWAGGVGGVGKWYASEVYFEWDPEKATRNIGKHKVSFNEAATIFEDPLSFTVPDPDHSEEERRLITFGTSTQGRLLMVAHTERGDRLRLISARTLTRSERKAYEEEISRRRR